MNESKPASLGDLFREYHYLTLTDGNPVTISVIMQCIRDRLDRLEGENEKR